jgi:hypothetical protein
MKNFNNNPTALSHECRKKPRRTRTAAVELLMLFSELAENVELPETVDGNVKVSPSSVNVHAQMFSVNTNVKIDNDTRAFLSNLVDPVRKLNSTIDTTGESITSAVGNLGNLPTKTKQILTSFFEQLFGKDVIRSRLVVLSTLACYRICRGSHLTTFERMVVLCGCMYLLYDCIEREGPAVDVYLILSSICIDVVALLLSPDTSMSQEYREQGEGFTMESLDDSDESNFPVTAQNGNDMSFDISQIESLIDLTLTGLGLTNAVASEQKASLFNQLKDITSMRSNFQKMIKSYIDIIVNFANWIALKLFGQLNWIRKSTGLVEADNIIERVDRYVRQSYSGTLPYSRGLVGDIESLRSELSDLIRCTPRTENSSGVIVELQKKANQLETIYQALCINPKHKAGYRFETILIYLDGKPGVGKTTVSNFIAAHCVRLTTNTEEFKHFAENTNHYIFQRNPENEYWDGYRSHHRVVKYDDIGQKRDQIGEDQWFEIIRAINVAPFHLHMSGIEDKRNCYFDSPFVVATSNIPHKKEDFISKIKSLNYPEALYRRLTITVEPIANTSISNNGKIDKELFEKVEVPSPFYWKYKVNGPGLTDRTLSWREFSQYLESVYNAQLKMFDRNVLGQHAYNQSLYDEKYADLYKSALPADIRFDNFLTRASNAVFDAADSVVYSNDDTLRSLKDSVIGGMTQNKQKEKELREATKMPGSVPVNAQVGSQFVSDWESAHPMTSYVPDPNDANGLTAGALVQDDSSEFSFDAEETDYGHVLNLLNSKLTSEFKVNYVDLSTLVSDEERTLFDPIWEQLAQRLSDDDIEILVSNMCSAMSFHGFVLPNDPYDVACLYYCKEPFAANTFRHVLLKKSVWDAPYGSSYVLPGIQSESKFESLAERVRSSLGLPSIETMKTVATVGLVLVGIWKASGLVVSIVGYIFPSISAQSTTHLSRNKNVKTKVNVKQHLKSIKQVRSVIPQNGDEETKESNSEENCDSIVKKNVIQVKVVSDGRSYHIGYALGIKESMALFPTHFISTVMDGHLEDSIMFVRGSVTVSVPVVQFLKTDRFIVWTEKDLALCELPANLGRFKDITGKFAKASERPINAVPIRIPIPHANIQYGTMAKIADYSLTYSVGQSFYDTRNVITYPCKTKRGDCGAPILRDDNLTQQRVVLGIHIARDDVQQAFSAAIYQETLAIMFSELNEDKPNYPPLEVQAQGGIPQFLEKFEILDSHPAGSNFVSAKNNISPSPVYECNDYHVPLTAPALLKSTGSVDPWEVSYRRYRKEPCDNVDQTALQKAYEDLCIFMTSQNTVKVTQRVISLAEAVFGDPGNEYLDSIKTSSSPGFPYKKTYPRWKKDIFGSNTFDETTEAYSQLAFEVDKIKSDWIKDLDPLIVYTENLKCERRPIHKVATGASRGFSGAPFPFSALVKMYYFTAGELMIRNRIKNSCTSGVNVYSAEWNELAEAILGFAFVDEQDHSVDLLGFDGDYSAFDANQIVVVMNKCFDWLDSQYPDATEDDKLVRKYIRKNIIYSKHIWKDVVFRTEGGNPSGNWLTTHINNLYNLLAFRYTYYRAMPSTRDLFHYHVALQVGGDDNVGSFDPMTIDRYNMQVVIQYMPEIGCKYTSADKSESTLEYKDFHNLTFLKRTFRKYEGNYIGPIDINSALEICQWTKTNRMDIFYTNVKNSLRELSLHPVKIFETKRSILKKYMDDRNLDTAFIEFQLPHRSLRDKVLKMEFYV